VALDNNLYCFFFLKFMNKKQLIEILRKEGFSEKILKAFNKVKREDFIPQNLKEYAYENEPLPIGYGQTISQPYTIAFMLNLLELDKLNNKTKISNAKKLKADEYELRGERTENNKKLSKNKLKILEIGSGSGHVLALMNEICRNCKIYGIERIKQLVEKSKKVLKNKKNIKIICKDGSKGIKNKKFDRILISAACSKIPEHLYSQLNENGIIVASVKNSIFQIKKENGKIKIKEFYGFVFVPLVGD